MSEVRETEAKVDQLIRTNKLLYSENALLRSFISRCSSIIGNTSEAVLDELEDEDTMEEEGDRLEVRILDAIAQREKDDLVADKKALDTEAQSLRLELEILIKATEREMADIKDTALTFRKDVLGDTGDPETPPAPLESGNVNSTALLSYLQHRIKHTSAETEKLNLQTTALNKQLVRLGQQLKHKEAAGNTFQLIDYDQLKIENQQYMERIQERNQQLLSLKLTSGHAVQTLNRLKVELLQTQHMMRAIQADVKVKQLKTDKLKASLESAKKLLEADQGILRALMQHEFSIADGPKPLSYIELVDKEVNVARKVAEYERKTALAKKRAHILK